MRIDCLELSVVLSVGVGWVGRNWNVAVMLVATGTGTFYRWPS
jgi:hypothetical protein